jgi:tetratricopeptide (TPR) repeat protein
MIGLNGDILFSGEYRALVRAIARDKIEPMVAWFALLALSTHPCGGCHPREVESYLRTGMGRSAGKPTGHPSGVVNHSASKTRFVIQATGEGMRHRMERPDSQADFPVAWFIGSGNHGRSYLIERDRRLFQSPVSWYTQRGRWDLSPGYDKDPRPDFSREVTGDCLFCHASARLEPIGCERCHGLVERHLAKPSKENIVNPVRLAPRVRDSVCEQCHLGGQARIPNPGRQFSDFQPGQLLEDVFTVYTAGASKGFQVVSHVEQLAQSRCAQASGEKMWCGSCHNPHGNPADSEQYSRRCLSCHNDGLPQSHPAASQGCAGCHMPKREAWDGGHAAFTDHRIQRRRSPLTPDEPSPLRAWREPAPQFRERNLGLAHVSVGERDSSMTDLEEGYRRLSILPSPDAAVETALGLVLLRRSKPLEALAHFERAAAAGQDPDHQHNLAIALRQAAESLYRDRRFGEAARVLDRYTRLVPEDFNARLLQGLALQQAGDLAEAQQVLLACTASRPRHATAWYSLARVQYLLGRLADAERNVRHALELGEPEARVHNLIGLIRSERGELEAALESFQRAAAAQPTGIAEAQMNAGVVLLKLGRTREALERLDQAASIQPKSAEVRYHRARAHLALNNRTGAEHDLAAAGDYEPARRLLAQLRAGGVGAAIVDHVRRTGVPEIRFRDMAEAAGIRFLHRNHPTPQKHLIETMPGGISVFDYNNDGRPDLYFTNGAAIPSLDKSAPVYWNRLYRNDGELRFTDVTAEAGVAGTGYSMGSAAADFDNDGHVDLFVAGYRRNLLYRNLGNGRFQDVTTRSGIRSDVWSVAGGWFDYDNDGRLDLLVVNYLDYALSTNEFCGDSKAAFRVYCHPSRFRGLPNTLYRNRGDGTFEDVTAKSGIGAHTGKGMSVAFADYDLDGDADIFVTNDTVPNFLFRNRGNGTFDEVGLEAGVALTDDGKAISSMGVDWRDYDNDGLPDIVVTALAGESFPLFRNQGKGYFRDFGSPSLLTSLSLRHSGWGIVLSDFNNDGWKDLFAANSHVSDNVESYSHELYREANRVFLNVGEGRFRDGGLIGNARAHRGAAMADFDADGRLDVVVSSIGEAAELWRNESRGGQWIAFQLRGNRSNRDGIGARVRIAAQHNSMTSSIGYTSSSLIPVHFGLGSESGKTVDAEVIWPSGAVQRLRALEPGRIHLVEEPSR